MNVVIGNADAHSKDISILHHENGSIELAPAYDLMCTRIYNVDTTAGMFVDGQREIDDIAEEHLINEAVSWRMGAGHAGAIVGELLDRLPSALDAAAAEVSAPKELVTMIGIRLQKMRSISDGQ